MPRYALAMPRIALTALLFVLGMLGEFIVES